MTQLHDGAPAPSVRGLLYRFAVAALFATVAVGALTAWLSRRSGTDEAEADASALNEVIAAGVIGPALTQGVLDGDPAALDAFNDVVRRSVIRGSLVRVKVWTADGRILYSDEQRLIGSAFELDENELAVFGGGPSVAELSDLGEPENRFETPGRTLLEVYSSVTGPNGEPLLLETYFAHDMVVAAGRKAWERFVPVSLAALGLLQLAQIPLVLQLVRRVRATQAMRESLLEQAVQASASERRRIAGDLHDGVVQDLTGVSYSLTALARDTALPQTAQQTLSSTAASVRHSVQGLRSLLVEIYPPNLAGEGIESAIRDLTSRLSARGLSTELRVTLPAAPELPEEVSALLYRGALEATRNITSHARASSVAIHLERDAEFAVLTVEDDGTGFDPSVLLKTPTNRNGHVGMRVLGDLARDYGGDVTVDSAPGRGTRVTLRVPVP